MGADTLPTIPLIDVRQDPLAAADPLAVRALRDAIFGGARPVAIPLLVVGDRVARRWLARSASPYTAELDRIASHARLAGLHAINISYEYGCTTLARSDGPGAAPSLRRTLDWPFRGLGRGVVVLHRGGPAGEFFDVTWPGAIGTLTAMAPGRFAAAINQAPLFRRTRAKWLRAADYAANFHGTMTRERGMPPLHLLRHAFETAPDFEQAVALLRDTEVARPVLFTVIGPCPGEIAIIERRERAARVTRGGGAIANDWLDPHPGWEPRACALPDPVLCSLTRRTVIAEAASRQAEPFAWIVPPVRNWNTRLGVEMNVGEGWLRVLGYEPVSGIDVAPATRPFRLTAAGEPAVSMS